jgi:hypothetical protein
VNLTELGNFIAQVGFPIAIAIYLLWREDRCLTFLENHHDEEMAALKAALRRRPASKRRGSA